MSDILKLEFIVILQSSEYTKVDDACKQLTESMREFFDTLPAVDCVNQVYYSLDEVLP